MSDFQYFVSDGGPHIVLPASVRSLWRGVGENYDPTDETTDYARACAVPPPVGLIGVGHQQALVLAGSPSMTAWNTSVRQDALNIYLLESWSTPQIEDLLRSAVAEALANEPTDTGFRWNVGDDLVVMFAGDRGSAATYGQGALPRLNGQYAIYTGRYEGKLGTLLLVRLERRGD